MSSKYFHHSQNPYLIVYWVIYVHVFLMMCFRSLKISVVLILVLVPKITTLSHHGVLKRSTLYGVECKGVYDKSIFFRLYRICEDCYQLYRETQIQKLCKQKCFTTDYFKGCVDALHLSDEVELLKNLVKIINGADPPPTPLST